MKGFLNTTNYPKPKTEKTRVIRLHLYYWNGLTALHFLPVPFCEETATANSSLHFCLFFVLFLKSFQCAVWKRLEESKAAPSPYFKTFGLLDQMTLDVPTIFRCWVVGSFDSKLIQNLVTSVSFHNLDKVEYSMGTFRRN